jgi:hypothetical protein
MKKSAISSMTLIFNVAVIFFRTWAFHLLKISLNFLVGFLLLLVKYLHVKLMSFWGP